MQDISSLSDQFKQIGLELNAKKCEMMYLNPAQSSPFPPVALSTMLPGLKVLNPSNFTLLNSPIFEEAIPDSIRKIQDILNTLCQRLEHLDSHTAFFLLSHYTAAPRLNYLMRSAPTFKTESILNEVDELIKSTTITVTNVPLNQPSWIQASLPTKFGGLGLRRVSSLSIPCYASSLNSAQELMGEILPSTIGKECQLDEAEAHLLTEYHQAVIPSGEARSKQRAWDEAICHQEFDELLSSANQVDSARLLAAASPHTGAWVHALPLTEIGLHLDKESVRIGVALRVGAIICEPHRCTCGVLVNTLGHHGLACTKSMGRLPRHSQLNDIVKRSLATAGIPSVLEPVGLDKRDGRRPDGITIFPFNGGKSLCWDATCVDTFCQSAIGETAHTPGAAANKAEKCKRDFYSDISMQYIFEPLAVETTGVLGKSTSSFIAQLGRRVSGVTGDKRETSWLHQRISIAVLRGNAASIQATGTLGPYT